MLKFNAKLNERKLNKCFVLLFVFGEVQIGDLAEDEDEDAAAAVETERLNWAAVAKTAIKLIRTFAANKPRCDCCQG